jgi:hypothetical protein
MLFLSTMTSSLGRPLQHLVSILFFCRVSFLRVRFTSSSCHISSYSVWVLGLALTRPSSPSASHSPTNKKREPGSPCDHLIFLSYPGFTVSLHPPVISAPCQIPGKIQFLALIDAFLCARQHRNFVLHCAQNQTSSRLPCVDSHHH